MKSEKSDWHFPLDWLCILSWYIVGLPLAFISVFFIPSLFAVPRGETRLPSVSLALAVIGIVLLFFARLPLYRQHRFFSFGPRELSAGHKKIYWAAYGFISVSIILMVLMLLVLKTGN